MPFRRTKQHCIDDYLLELLEKAVSLLQELVNSRKKAEKKDLFNIIDDMLQDLPKQENCNTDDIVLQEEFAFQRDLYAFFQELGLKFPCEYRERKDHGVDMWFIYNNDVYIVQAKTVRDQSRGISPDSIRELAGVQHIRADRRIFVTNARYTLESIRTAELAGVYLIDGDRLKMLVQNRTRLKTMISHASM